MILESIVEMKIRREKSIRMKMIMMEAEMVQEWERMQGFSRIANRKPEPPTRYISDIANRWKNVFDHHACMLLEVLCRRGLSCA